MYALLHASRTLFLWGNYVEAKAEIDEFVALADQKGSPFWKTAGILNQGSALKTLTGKASDAVQMITTAIPALQSTGSTFWMPLHLSYLARAYAGLGQLGDARRCIGEAMTTVETTEERWWEAEICRVAGEIALRSPERDTAKAQAYFERALTVARHQRAKSWELRAATSMARLWRDQGKRDAARDLLAPLYGWFTWRSQQCGDRNLRLWGSSHFTAQRRCRGNLLSGARRSFCVGGVSRKVVQQTKSCRRGLCHPEKLTFAGQYYVSHSRRGP